LSTDEKQRLDGRCTRLLEGVSLGATSSGLLDTDKGCSSHRLSASENDEAVETLTGKLY
jgi:hypothetical protein